MEWEEHWFTNEYGLYLDCVTATHVYALGKDQLCIAELASGEPYHPDQNEFAIGTKADLPPEVRARYEEILPLLLIRGE